MQPDVQYPSRTRLQPLSIGKIALQPANDDVQELAPRLHRASDDGMQPCGIRQGDMLSIQHRPPRSGETVLARLNGRLLVRRLRQLAGQTLLLADQPGFAPCYVLDSDHFELIGVVSGRFRL